MNPINYQCSLCKKVYKRIDHFNQHKTACFTEEVEDEQIEMWSEDEAIPGTDEYDDFTHTELSMCMPEENQKCPLNALEFEKIESAELWEQNEMENQERMIEEEELNEMENQDDDEEGMRDEESEDCDVLLHDVSFTFMVVKYLIDTYFYDSNIVSLKSDNCTVQYML